MKIIGMFILAISLLGCGQKSEQPSPVDISMTTIVWQGSTEQNPDLLLKFTDTMACLAELNIHRSGYPYTVIVETPFRCGQNQYAAGCYADNTIFFAENLVTITTSSVSLSTLSIYQHEVVHWAGLDASVHGSIYFEQCAPY